jgi:glucose/arabinose dehydrogenase
VRTLRVLRGRRTISVAAAIAAVMTLAAFSPAAKPAAVGSPPKLVVSTLLSGLDHPWDLAFTPDGTAMVYDERVGRVWATSFPGIAPVLLGNLATLQTSPNFVAQGEGGVLGLAIDPSFATNHYVYACYDTAVDVRVVRFTTNLIAGSLAINAPIVTGMPVNTISGRHSGCRPRFRPGTNPPQLVIGTGDTATDGTIPQNLHSLGGKVLCVLRDGTPCPGNPGITNPALDIDDRILSWGHRNVQGIALNATGGGYSIEHGTDRDDEINSLVPGNFGWNPVPSGGGTGYDESQPMTAPGGIAAAWSSGFPTIAPSGATMLAGTQWKRWNGSLAVAVLKAKELLVVTFDSTGTAAIATSVAMNNLGYRLRSAVQGPDGNLYVSTDNGSATDVIYRVVPR